MLTQPCSLVLKFFRSSVLLLFLGSLVSFSSAGQLIYSTYLGGSGTDCAYNIAVDIFGNAYLTGWTDSSDFPTTSGTCDTGYNGSEDVFVTKINAHGTALIYSTYLGGSNDDSGRGITVDTSGNAYITGYTSSTDFPITNGAWDTSYNGYLDVYVSKLNPNGTGLIYSTYLGGRDNDTVSKDIGLDNAGNVYITGDTYSDDFPTTAGAFDTSFNGAGSDVFVTKLNANGTALIYSTYLGKGYGRGITIDSSRNAYITGWTDSSDFPTTSGAFDTSYNGTDDVFVSKLYASGTAVVYSIYLGGSYIDRGFDITVDTSGNAYITGYTISTDFPTTLGAFDTTLNINSNDTDQWGNPHQDVFVTKLNASGTGLVYSTYLGGGGNDAGFGIAIDNKKNVYITGFSDSSTFPTTPGALDTSFNGAIDVIASKINDSGTGLIYSTYLGGSEIDIGYGIALDASDYVYLTGRTTSSNFPTTTSAMNTSWNGKYDVFVTKMSLVVSSPYLNSYGEFTVSNDTKHWYFEKYGDGIAPGALMLDTTYGFAAINQSPGEKGKLTQVFSVPSTGWYTARAKVWSTIVEASKQQKVYLYLQELDNNNQVVASVNQVVQAGSGFFVGAWNPKDLVISFYAQGTKLAVQLIAINPANSGETGSLCIDYVRVTEGANIPLNEISLTNPGFSAGTNGWILEPYGDAAYAGIWTTAWSVLALTQDGGNKGKVSQLFNLPTTEQNVYASAWVYSDATSISETQKVYLYLYDYSIGYNKVVDSGNMILQPGKWTPGEWHQLQLVFPASSNNNAVQLVGINPDSNSWAGLYFDVVEVKQ